MLSLVSFVRCTLTLSIISVFSCGSAVAEPVHRHILALYDSSLEPTPTDTLIHMNAEMPLNHLGYILDYHDLAKGLPSDSELEGEVAILTMFAGDITAPAAYFRWLSRKAEVLPRMIILGDLGGPFDDDSVARLQPVFRRMGLRLTSDYITNARHSRVVVSDPGVIGFEAKPDPVPPEHTVVEARGDQAQIGLEYDIDRLGQHFDSVVVATGPGGGYAASGFFIYFDPKLNLKRWIINPFEFFRRALNQPRFPIPDTTTVSGRRLYFSEVDGDGWNSVTRIERYRDQNVTTAQVMIQELIEPYADLPVSVAFLLGDLDPRFGARPDTESLVKRAFALPQVEVASHTLSHPFDWGFYEHYDRNAEVALVKEVFAQRPESFVGKVKTMLGLGSPADSRRFIASDHTLPRAYLKDPFDLDQEIGGALRRTEALAPPGKHIAIYQWSGDAHPFEAAIRATREAGVRNINGGDTRFDDQNPSVSYIAPLSRTVGAERQIYAVDTNENNYTFLWTDRFHGFRQLRETLKRTEDPRRLRGIDIYYHTYSAERAASLDAVRSHLDWARTQPIAPVRTSTYAAIADGFFSSEIESVGPLEWTVANRDGLNTVRFDDAGALQLDMAASRGVLGSTRHDGSLYVALDSDVAAATVAIKQAGQELDTDGARHGRACRQPLARARPQALALRVDLPGLRFWRRRVRVDARAGQAVRNHRQAPGGPHCPLEHGCESGRPAFLQAAAGRTHPAGRSVGDLRVRRSWPVMRANPLAIVIGLAIAAAAASTVFLPGAFESMSMLSRDNRGEAAVAVGNEAREQGDRNPAFLDDLIDLNRRYGDPDSEAAAIEEYLKSHPNDLAGTCARPRTSTRTCSTSAP